MVPDEAVSPMTQGELASHKRKLATAEHLDLVNFLNMLLKLGRVPPELVPSLVETAKRSESFYPDLLAKFIVATGSIALYEACESKFEKAPADLIPVFAKLYSPTIEKRLCDFFYKELQSKEPFPWFDTCLDALTKNGQRVALETLEALDYELGPKANVAKVIASAIEAEGLNDQLDIQRSMRSMLDGLTIHRVSRIRKGLEVLRTRMPASGIDAQAVTSSGPVVDVSNSAGSKDWDVVKDPPAVYAGKAMARAQVHMLNAIELRLLKRYADAGNNYRKAGEALLKAVYAVGANKTKIPTTLENLKTNVKSNMKDNPLPDSIEKAIDALQTFGNLASHDQSDDYFQLSEEVAAVLESSLNALSNWAKTVVRA